MMGRQGPPQSSLFYSDFNLEKRVREDHILRADRSLADGLVEAITALKEETRYCSVCCGLTEADPCSICSDPRCSSEVICVVEEPGDLIAIERSREFNGRYHVLHGRLAPLDGVGPEELKVKGLLDRLNSGEVREVIIATNATVEGEATAMYLARLIKPLGIRTTRIAHGLPMGGDVEYADEVTPGRALEGRREMLAGRLILAARDQYSASSPTYASCLDFPRSAM